MNDFEQRRKWKRIYADSVKTTYQMQVFHVVIACLAMFNSMIATSYFQLGFASALFGANFMAFIWMFLWRRSLHHTDKLLDDFAYVTNAVQMLATELGNERRRHRQQLSFGSGVQECRET